MSQCTYRCVVLPDDPPGLGGSGLPDPSQCTYRCVVLPDEEDLSWLERQVRLNAPTGAWCSLTGGGGSGGSVSVRSQCTYRCVVLPDSGGVSPPPSAIGLNAPTGAWCSLTLAVYRHRRRR